MKRIAGAPDWQLPCDLRETSHGSVCVCNSTYCDYLEPPQLTDISQIVVISSSKVSQEDCPHSRSHH